MAAAPGPIGAVVARLAHCHATLNWEVAEQAGQKKSQDAYGRPPDAAMRLAARERLVRAHILIVVGAVVEQAFDTAHASYVVHCRGRRAKASAAAHPTGRQGPRAGAFFALAPAAVLAAIGVLAVASLGWDNRKGLQLILFHFQTLGLHPDDLIARPWRVSQKSLLGRGAPRAGPGCTVRNLAGGTDGSAYAAPWRPSGLLRRRLPGLLGPR